MHKLLIVVDMQNDFITGSLANPDAEKIVPKIAEYIKNFDGMVIATKDTHFDDNYLEKQEGKRLPIPHCIWGTEGSKIVDDIQKALNDLSEFYCYKKGSFGATNMAIDLAASACRFHRTFNEIYICGTCTDICVISNAILCKSFVPEAKIIVLKDLCAGTTPENHENALKAMAQCQIDIE